MCYLHDINRLYKPNKCITSQRSSHTHVYDSVSLVCT